VKNAAQPARAPSATSCTAGPKSPAQGGSLPPPLGRRRCTIDVDGDADCPQHGHDKLVAEQGEDRAQDAGTNGSRRPRNRAGVRRSTVSAA
jgi:hypothetical protein